MKNQWSVTVTDWQGVDNEPIAGSNNLVKSGGIEYNLTRITKKHAYINKLGVEVANVSWSQGLMYSLLPVSEGDIIEIYGATRGGDLYPIILFNEDRSLLLPVTTSLSPNKITVQSGYEYCACNFSITTEDNCIRHNNAIYGNSGKIIDALSNELSNTRETLDKSLDVTAEIAECLDYEQQDSITFDKEYIGKYIALDGGIGTSSDFSVKLFDVSSLNFVVIPFFVENGTGILSIAFYNLQGEETPNSNNFISGYSVRNAKFGLTQINNFTHIAVCSMTSDISDYHLNKIDFINTNSSDNKDIIYSFEKTNLEFISDNTLETINIYTGRYMYSEGGLGFSQDFSVYVYSCENISCIGLHNFKKEGNNILYAAFYKGSISIENLIKGYNVNYDEDTAFQVPKGADIFCICSLTSKLEKTDVYSFSPFKQLITSNWKGKTALFYGDSITEIGQYGDVVNGEMEYPYDQTSMTNNWQRRLCNILGIKKFYSRGIGSAAWAHTGFVAYVDSTHGHLIERPIPFVPFDDAPEREGCTKIHFGMSDWDRITTQIPKNIRETIDLIFMFTHNGSITSFVPDFKTENVVDTYWMNYSENPFGGDYNTTDEANALVSTIMKLQIWCPNAVIVIGTPMSGLGTLGEDTTDLTVAIGRLTTVNKTLEIAQLMSIPCINVWGEDGINPLNRTQYISDGIHPYNANGAKMLARTLACGLNNIYPKI